MENLREYRSQDFYITACLIASGIKLKRLEPKDARLVTFVLDDPQNLATKIITDHWNRTNRLPSRDLVEAINELRTRLHSGV